MGILCMRTGELWNMKEGREGKYLGVEMASSSLGFKSEVLGLVSDSEGRECMLTVSH